MEIAYVNIHVSDLERAMQFYRDVLCLPLAFADPEHGYASFSAGPISLGIAEVSESGVARPGVHTGIGFNTTDLEAEYARLKELGVVFTMLPSRQPWGGFMAMMADPDGNVFYLDEVAAAHA